MESLDIVKKSANCLNCKKELADEFEFCPYCGQKNNNTNLSFGQLAGDFLTNYFTLDSKFIRSVIPFLFKPGLLTLQFVEGKRQSYANPVRLYLIISFFYFFVLSFLATDMSEGATPSAESAVVNDSTKTLHLNLSNTGDQLTDNDSLPEKTKYVIPTSSGNSVSIDTSTGWPLTNKQWNIFFNKEAKDLSQKQLFDSLHVENRSSFDQHIIKQMIRVKDSNKEFVMAFFLKNMSFMMFLLLPIFALILKLLYVRRKTLYIKHLVHTLHLHSFAFLIYGFALTISIWIVDVSWAKFLAVAIVTIYAYSSFKRVYRQGHKKTLLKFMLAGLIYSVILLLGTIVEVLLSLLIF